MRPGPDVRQVGGACTSAQLRNITLCSQLNEVHRSLMNLLPRLPAQAAANLRSAPSLPLIKILSCLELRQRMSLNQLTCEVYCQAMSPDMLLHSAERTTAVLCTLKLHMICQHPYLNRAGPSAAPRESAFDSIMRDVVTPAGCRWRRCRAWRWRL